jgi:hypothetical protein
VGPNHRSVGLFRPRTRLNLCRFMPRSCIGARFLRQITAPITARNFFFCCRYQSHRPKSECNATTACTRSAVGRSENTDASGRSRPVTRPDLPLPWFARAPESPSRTLEGSWLAFSPSALGFPWALGSSGSGPRGTSRRIPTQVLSCACAPPQWLSLSRVAPFRRLSRPCHRHKAPRIGPRPFSISKQKNPFSRPAFGRASNRRCHTDWKSRLQGLATLLAA